MDVQTHSSSADLTTPLLPPQILSSFEALSAGRCSLSQLNRSVLEACRSDPGAADGVLLLLESYASSGELDRFDLGALKRALEHQQRACDPEPLLRDPVADPVLGIDDDPLSVDPGQGWSVAPTSLSQSDNPVVVRTEPRILRGRYILDAEIGRGGTATVYRAIDLNRVGLPDDGRYVALKVLREEAARQPGAVDALRHEYHQAQMLSHPGIVNVFDFDHDGDRYFVTMELLDGESLGTLVRRLLPNKLPIEATVRILRELGDAVAHAHDRGVLHLDLKPDNVMIDAQGHVRVLDFGLARAQMSQPVFAAPVSPPAATLPYASCERLVQERPDVRDDIFSFSCIAYELLSGRHPFDRYSALRARKEGRKARRIRGLSYGQWDALASGLAWAREERPTNMRELLQGLALQSSGRQRAPRRVMWLPVAAAALLVLGAAAMLSWSRMQMTPAPALGAPDLHREEPSNAKPVDAQPVAEADIGDVDRGAPEAMVAAPKPPPGESASAASPGPDPAWAIKAAGAVAETPKPPAEGLDVLGFSRHSFSVSESDSVARLDVRRVGGATGEISFQWYTVDDSARVPQDYVFGFGETRMAPGQTTATLEVPIVADSIPEDPELLQVVIGHHSGARVGPAGRVPVIIVDDD